MVSIQDPKKIVQEKQKSMERQLNDLEEATSKLAERVTAALVNYEEHIRDHHERLKLMSNKVWSKNQSNDTEEMNLPKDWCERDALLQCFVVEQDSLKEIRCRLKEMMKCGSDGRARMEQRTRKEPE